MKENKNAKGPNRVWIEIERGQDDAKNVERAEAFTKMLNKLGIQSCKVEWNKTTKFYEYTNLESQSFIDLVDDGHFFNLDYLAK